MSLFVQKPCHIIMIGETVNQNQKNIFSLLLAFRKTNWQYFEKEFIGDSGKLLVKTLFCQYFFNNIITVDYR